MMTLRQLAAEPPTLPTRNHVSVGKVVEFVAVAKSISRSNTREGLEASGEQ
jgi:hypothetical protein